MTDIKREYICNKSHTITGNGWWCPIHGWVKGKGNK